MPAAAQPPEIAGVLPPGGQRGTTLSVQIDGKNLRGARPFLSGTGIRVESVEPNEDGTAITLKLAIQPEAPLGSRELRLGSEQGISNPARLWIDAFPDLLEKEPNGQIFTAQALPRTPVVVSGRIQAEKDRDVYTIQAEAGEQWVFDCNAARLRSRLDPVLELRDEAGRLLQRTQPTDKSDPRILYPFTTSGRYFLTIRDIHDQGGLDYTYRLTTGVLPVITDYVPRGERPGRAVGLVLEGINLGGRNRAIVRIPADVKGGEVWVAPETERGPALPIPLLVDPAPVASVTETDANMPLLAPPVLLDGTFRRYPRARFFFRATPQDRLVFDLFGRRIGSRIDGALRVLDSAGKEVASANDGIGRDARLEFTPAVAGTYTIEARNVEGKTGPDCFYRLAVYRAVPDFHVMLNTDRVNLGAGGSVAISLSTEKLHGFDHPIEIRAEGLPRGVACSGGVIAPGQNDIEITLTAAPEAPHGPVEIRLLGVASLGGKRVTREAAPRELYMPRFTASSSLKGDGQCKLYRACELLLLAVTERLEPFALETLGSLVKLAPGKKTEIVVRAMRNPGAQGEIVLELRGLPRGVTANTPPIPAGQTESRITLTARPGAPTTQCNLIIQGRLDQATQVAPAVRLTVGP